MTLPRRAVVRVPATSANLGAGFDSFALALDVADVFEAEVADEWSVEVAGEGVGRLASDATNLVAAAARRVFEEAGFAGALRIRCENRVPVGKGLGSSAAAIVGGVLLADALCGCGMSREEIVRRAVEGEGHADNAAAALLGGFVVARREGDAWAVERFEPGCGVAVVAAISERELPTAVSRQALPDSVPHADAAANAARAALFALGIVTGRDGLIAAGARDYLHEPYRAPLVPDIEQARCALLDAGATAAVLSGAGPTVLGLFTGDDDAEALERAEAAARAVSLPSGRTALVAPVDRRGAVVERVA